jgi:hypothetical protein
MPVLGATALNAICGALMRLMSVNAETIPITKPDLLDAITAADAWIDANAASFNAALPAPFRTTATQAQKARLLSYIALKRTGQTVPMEE